MRRAARCCGCCEPLRPGGGEIAVDVGPHPEHGSLITVGVAGVSGASRAELRAPASTRCSTRWCCATGTEWR